MTNSVFFIELFVLLSGLMALVHAFYIHGTTDSAHTTNDKVKQVAGLICDGAITYLAEQYRIICIVGLAIAALLFYFLNDWVITAAFLLGAISSGLAGYVGMLVAVRYNSLTAIKSQQGLISSFITAYTGGSLVGSLVIGSALLCLFVISYIFTEYVVDTRQMINVFIALSFGASLISLFARLGGGIFTKGADIGADLSGKLDMGIPEDDPRNPAVIADNVGDNVGDCAGMVADLFETYLVTMSAAIILAMMIQDNIMWSWYPLSVGAVAIPATLLAHLSITQVKHWFSSIMVSIYVVVLVSALLSMIGLGITTYLFFNFTGMQEIFVSWDIYTCAVLGFLLPILLIASSDQVTGLDSHQVRTVVKESQGGHATNIISGLAAGMGSVIWPSLIVCVAIFTCTFIAGVFGVAVAVSAMLSLSGVILTLDVYGPITDNAGGIAEMSNMPSKCRQVTDRLDSVGNTTKAITKNYAISSAALGSVVLFSVFMHDIKNVAEQLVSLSYIDINYELTNPYVILGLLLGGAVPFLFSASAMKALNKVANEVVREVRQQFEDGKILSGERKPDYNKTIKILTNRSIVGMIIPALMPVLLPVIIYLIFSRISLDITLEILGSTLLGIIVTGFYLAITMTSSGAIWDNAKKYFEIYNIKHDAKYRDAYDAAITGDLVGDPCKDTAGPAINPMIKIANVVSLLLLIFLTNS